MTGPKFPWGDLNPEDGFQVGDYVGLIYSDHEEYIFDNPVGIVTAVSESDEDGEQQVTVQVDAAITSTRVYLIKRAEAPA